MAQGAPCQGSLLLPGPGRWSQGLNPSRPFSDKGGREPASPRHGKQGLLQGHPQESLGESPLFLIPPRGLAFMPDLCLHGSAQVQG